MSSPSLQKESQEGQARTVEGNEETSSDTSLNSRFERLALNTVADNEQIQQGNPQRSHENLERSTASQPSASLQNCGNCLALEARVGKLESALRNIKSVAEKEPTGVSERILGILNEPGLLNPTSSSQSYSTDLDLNSSRLEQDFEVLPEIGSGAYGSVLKVRHKLDGKEYALKKIILLDQEREVEEVKILCNLVHPHVIRYYSSWLQKTRMSDRNSSSSNVTSTWSTESAESQQEGSGLTMFIKMELCDSNLRRAIDEGGLPENLALAWAYIRQIISGLEYIHGEGVVHRDLKPENIFVTACKCIKIGDFGLSTRNRSTFGLPRHDETRITASQGMTEGVGTWLYNAPEKNTKYYDWRSDIYSLGVIILEMLQTFHTRSELYSIFTEVSSEQVELPSDFKRKLIDSEILELCLNHRLKSRPSLDQLSRLFVEPHDCALMLLHPDDLAVNWFQFKCSRHIKYLRVNKKRINSTFLKENFFNTNSLYIIFVEYRPAASASASKSKSGSTVKPEILFHHKLLANTEFHINDTIDWMTVTAEIVRESVEEYHQSANSVLLQKIYDALREEDRASGNLQDLENFSDFVETCRSRASFVCTVVVDPEKKFKTELISIQEVIFSPWDDDLRISFDYSKVEDALRPIPTELDLGSNSVFARDLQQCLKDAGFIDDQNYFTKAWLKSCASKFIDPRRPDLASTPYPEDLSQRQFWKLLKKLFFKPYFVKFNPLMGLKAIETKHLVGQPFKICAMEKPFDVPEAPEPDPSSKFWQHVVYI